MLQHTKNHQERKGENRVKLSSGYQVTYLQCPCLIATQSSLAFKISFEEVKLVASFFKQQVGIFNVKVAEPILLLFAD